MSATSTPRATGTGRSRHNGATAHRTAGCSQAADQPRPISASRRIQIVRATIEAVAELGYAGATFKEIAARGGLSSTRFISYHFIDRAELMREVARTVIGDLGASVACAMRQTQSPRQAVHTYLRANIAYINSHRAEIRALTACMFAGVLEADAGQGADAAEHAIAQLIEAGVRQGEFACPDPAVAAAVLQRVVEGVCLQLYRNPGLVLHTLGEDLVAFVDTGLGVGSAAVPLTTPPRRRQP